MHLLKDNTAQTPEHKVEEAKGSAERRRLGSNKGRRAGAVETPHPTG